MSMIFSSDYLLPEEMMIEILLRLPIKSLLQFTSVCKSWNSLIRNKTFIKNHLKLSTKRITRDGPLFLLRHCPKEPNVEQYSLHSDNHTFQEYSKPQLPAKSFNECFRVVGSCNGLVLLSDDYLTETNTLVLWNPSIRKSITIPKPHIPHSQYYTVYGFGYDALRDDYKILQLVYEGPNRAGPEVGLYSLSSGSWKTVAAAFPKYEVAPTLWSQVFVNGSIHFTGYSKKDDAFRNVVIGFDVYEEAFREIELPKDIASARPNMFVTAIGESLTMQHYDFSERNCCNVWCMREYGVVESWTKQFTIDFVTPNFRVTRVLGCRKNGEFILEVYKEKKGEIVLQDPKENKNVYLGIYTDPGYTSMENYLESLVLLDKAT